MLRCTRAPESVYHQGKYVRIDFTEHGIYLPGIDLWLDPRGEARAVAWISHAHSDHAQGFHAALIGTPQTLALYRMRWAENSEIPQSLQPLPFEVPMELRGARLTCYPAGHIVGAAQLLIEYGGERVLYTGDIKLQDPICGVATEIIPCDRLIVESTFGLPIFHFLPAQAARERIVSFATECLNDSITPVFVGYALGRGQEIVHVLAQAGIGASVHGAIARLMPVYERAGYTFPGWTPYASRELEGKALVVVPNMRAFIEASGRNTRVAYVSGWAAL